VKELKGYFKSYFETHFHKGYFIFITLYTSLLVFLNYFLDLTSTIRSTARWNDGAFVYYLIVFSLGLIVPYLVQRIFFTKSSTTFLSNKKFWAVICFGLIIWSARSSLIYYFQFYIGTSVYGVDVRSQFEFRTFFMLLKSTIGFLPILIYWRIIDKKHQPFYGMNRGQINLKPYFILLLMLIPLVILASQNVEFLSKYPKAQVMYTIELFNEKHSGFIALYESMYILDFYIIELFFRGFMILAFIKFSGPKAILPVTVFYVTLHFGKPFGEALGSFFGGAILGVITYYSRSIWGGIIIHMGIALTMEISAYIAHYFRQ